MSEPQPYVAHHFDDAEQQQGAATLGMWMFLVNEIMFFGGLFLAYAVYRSAYPDAFVAASHHLDIKLGLINTAILIGSSLTMALAVHASQIGHQQRLTLFLILTIVLGGAFLGIKAVEYAHKFHEHHVPGALFHWDGPTNSGHAQIFFGLYFAMTGMHALHMLIGIGILLVLVANSMRGQYGRHYFTPIEIFGLYWHFVDIVWIFLFPLLYLIGRH